MSLSLVGISPTKDRRLYPLHRQCSRTWHSEVSSNVEAHTSDSAGVFIFLDYVLNWRDVHLVNSAFDPTSFLFRLARGHDFGIFGHQEITNTSVLAPTERRKALQNSERQQDEVVGSESNRAPLYRTAIKASMVNPGQVSIRNLRARNGLRGKNIASTRPRYTSIQGQTREWDEIKSQGVIISGLFRERHSVQITPDDSALVLTLRETIEDLKKKEARMSRQIEKLGTKLIDRRGQAYKIFPNSVKSTFSLDQRSSKHTASTNSLSPSDRFSYQSSPSSSTSVRSDNRRSEGYKSESEQKHKSYQGAKERLPQDEAQVNQVLRKQLQAERELILALEEAVTDLQANVKELLSECDHWKQQSTQLQIRVDEYKDTIASHEANNRRFNAINDCQRTLSQRMQFFNKGHKKKRGFNCL
ncbi:uncharacterized protein FMAN_15180 [Fusarium mangiferae]|uniref:Uncharacterized protein n=1 Tax=Fusarium mangiferae TaxID=192010 RepID=A0A1L7U677_FUSMA|nr:uncharacterized protein FMAN_15180 [Fusarium mangiferae]CVL03465.1 uncharacterized protein FMAN_15180 [Fusarium mangiferae]